MLLIIFPTKYDDIFSINDNRYVLILLYFNTFLYINPSINTTATSNIISRIFL